MISGSYGVSISVSTDRAIPVVGVDYVLLTVAAGVDASGRYRYLTDVFAVADGMSFSLSKPFSDSFSTADAPPTFVVGKVLADSVSFTELFNAILVFLRDFVDTQEFSDARVLTVSKPVSDVVSFLETKSFVLTRTLADGFAMNDSFAAGDGATYSFTKTVNNVVFLEDEISQIITKPVADSVTMLDSGVGSMQDYCDITYFAGDYVGFGFTF